MKLRLSLRFAALAAMPLIVPGIYGALAHDLTAYAAAPAASNAPAAPFASDRISVSVTGQGPDVILIPGLASSAHVWDATVAHLSATHRVHVVQVAGFAGTPAGGNASGPVFEPLVGAVHDYITVNHLQGATVIGHSLGGTMALRLAISHPGDAGKVMVVDALPYIGMLFGPQLTVAMVQPQATMIRNQVVNGTQEAYAAAEPAQMAPLVKSKNAEAAAALAAAVASDHRVVGQALYDDLTTDLRPDLGKITIPVTVLYPWDETSPSPQQVVDTLYTQAFAPLPHGKVERINGSYHFIMIDQPAAFMQKVDAFLGS
jgi:pimeloyl-ACP methyl ester carboxylesterase